MRYENTFGMRHEAHVWHEGREAREDVGHEARKAQDHVGHEAREPREHKAQGTRPCGHGRHVRHVGHGST